MKTGSPKQHMGQGWPASPLALSKDELAKRAAWNR